MGRRFRGGLLLNRWAAGKEAAQATVSRRLSPDILALSLRQRGQPLTPCVSAGDRVRVGDRLAEDPREEIPPLHSGVSGRVRTVEDRWPMAEGGFAPAILLENDGEDRQGEPLPPLERQPTPADIVRRMYEAGLVGMGGGGFPTHRKYRDLRADFLLINGCECEPFLAADVRCCVEQAETVAQGARLMATAAGVPESGIRVCVESAAAAAALRDVGLTVEVLPTRYPQGGERQLVHTVLSRRLADGQRPAQRGVAVSNVATAAALGDAARGWPLTHRLITVSGEVAAPVNLLVPIGTPFSAAASQVSITAEGRVRYIAGGPMTGRRLTDPAAGIPKTCGGLTVLPARHFESTPCIRCGECGRVCPEALMPFLIEEAALTADEDRCRLLRADACIACGCCSFICPARRPLAARVAAVRDTIRGGLPLPKAVEHGIR